MAVDQKLKDKMCEQIRNELHAAYLYLGVSEYFESMALKGLAKWMLHHAKEEIEHAMKFYRHLVDRNERITFHQIEAVNSNYKSPLEAAKAAYNHEVKVTKQINDLYKLADDVHDPAAKELLLWFAKEQVEEEEVTRTLVDLLTLAQNDTKELLLIDYRYGKSAKKDHEEDEEED
ncbi:MAG: ferritin [Candidatus Micrarchaeota archaeon]|nr:ferritin [Candidatus Micrarchaeota archaeon]